MNTLPPKKQLLGPNLNYLDREVYLLTPPTLMSLAKKYQSWAHSSSTPTHIVTLRTGLKSLREAYQVKIILYSSEVSETLIESLVAELSLINMTIRASFKLWSIDASMPPKELTPLIPNLTLTALSLSLKDRVLTEAFRNDRFPVNHVITFEQSTYPQQYSNDNADFAKNITFDSFDISELMERAKRIRGVGQAARLPILLGIFCSVLSLLFIEGGPPKLWVGSLFVFAQLITGVGVVGCLWSVFEYKGLRERIFLFWIDPDQAVHQSSHPHRD